MKKTLFLSVFTLVSFFAFTQVKLGLNFSPALAFSRLNYQSVSPNQSYDAKGVGIRFIAGPEVSFYLGENVAFTTGAWYALKRSAINSVSPSGVKKDSAFNLQYIMLPATFKLFTNEIATDMKLYFQLGGSLDIKLSEHLIGYDYKINSQFKPYDVSLLVGSGVEYQLGESTYFLIGLRYTRGLVNTVRGTLSDQISVKNSLLSLDLGLRF
jgi:hypothetical protein